MEVETHSAKTTRSLFDHDVVRGALAGLIATVPMTWAIREIDASADDELAADVSRKAGYPLDADHRRIAAYVARFGFGAFAGIVYALAAPKLKTVRPEVKGPLIGLTLWGASLVNQRASGEFRLSSTQQTVMMGSHLAWGLAVTRLLQMTTSEMITDLATGVMGHTPLTRKLHRLVS